MSESHQAVWRANALSGWPEAAETRGASAALGSSYVVLMGHVKTRGEVPAGTANPWLLGVYKEWRAGWPFKCLRARAWRGMKKNDLPNSSAEATSGWWEVPRAGILTKLPRKRLPIEPIWAGLMANTLVFGALFFACSRVPGYLRRRARIGRACCPECGYPAGVSRRCTECGCVLRPEIEPRSDGAARGGPRTD